MSSLFKDKEVFNSDIGSWDTSSVTDMRDMFSGAALFDQNIGAWDTSNVVDMTNMFRNAQRFDQNLSAWDTSSVTDLQDMFLGASSFRAVLCWDISSLSNASRSYASSENSVIFSEECADCVCAPTPLPHCFLRQVLLGRRQTVQRTRRQSRRQRCRR